MVVGAPSSPTWGRTRCSAPSRRELASSHARILHVGNLGAHPLMDVADAAGSSGWSALLAAAQAAGMHTNLELAGFPPDRLAALAGPCLPYLDSIIVNELEAAALTGTSISASTADEAVDWAAMLALAQGLLERGVSGLAVVHFPAGSVGAAPDGRTWRQGSVLVPPDRVRSTTGAGDAFAAGVVFGLHERLVGGAESPARRGRCGSLCPAPPHVRWHHARSDLSRCRRRAGVSTHLDVDDVESRASRNVALCHERRPRGRRGGCDPRQRAVAHARGRRVRPPPTKWSWRHAHRARSLGRPMHPATLSLGLERRAEDIYEPEFSAYVPHVQFEAFLAAQRLFGWVRLEADRLTDLLNSHELVRLTNVLVEDIRDGDAVLADETLVPRSEIVAVVASGPRGDPSRRVETDAYPVVIESGVYRIGGLVHAPPGVDPAERLRAGDPMLPLTEAWLEYAWGERDRRDTKATVIVNCRSASRIELV